MARHVQRLRQPSKNWQCIISAEHASKAIPQAWKHLFRGKSAVLESHRGWDPGTAQLANAFQKQLQLPVISASWSRLLVELNRSSRHPKLFSEFTCRLTSDSKGDLLQCFYHPHRQSVQTQIAHQIERGHPVIHLALHSFTPILNGMTRRADIGLLFDPRRDCERQFCRQWQTLLKQCQPTWTIRRNYPYLGISDGFTTALRRQFAADQYVGVELEVNQKWFSKGADTKLLIRTVVETFSEMLQQFSRSSET